MKPSTKTALMAIATGSLILGACTKKPANTTVAENMAESQEIAAAVMADKPLKCIITNTTETNTLETEYYVKGQKMRMLLPQEEPESMNNHMINDGEYIYIWEEGATEGIKNRIPTEEEITETTEQMEDYTSNLPDFYDQEAITEYEETGYSVNCEKGSFGDEMFTPPQDVTFVSFEDKMQDALKEMQNSMKEIEGMPNIELPSEANGMLPPQ